MAATRTRAAKSVRRLADGGFQVEVLLDEVVAGLEVALPHGSEPQRPRMPDDELDAETLLQLGDDVARRRLRQLVRRRRFREAAAAGDVTEHFERFKLHGEMLPCGSFM